LSSHSGGGARRVYPEPYLFSTRSFSVAKFSTWFKVKVVLICIGVIILLAFYSYFIPDTVRTRITDAQMAKVDGRFMIATEYRPFVNYDAKYRFKFNSGTIQNEAVRLKGREATIRKYGWRVPLFSMYENIVSIKEVK
jgi:hypothetical protein